MERLKHFIESQQLNQILIADLFSRARHFSDIDKKGILAKPKLTGKIMASVFYEPSTRTRFSFESAMRRLGGEAITTENAKEFSSASKGESSEDSARVIAGYSDVIVIRHNITGEVGKFAKVSPVPIINAGDGGGQHPTQALLDLYTILDERGRIDDLKILMVGDLKHGRTVRSLCYLLGKYKGPEIIFVSPENLKMDDDVKYYLTEKGIKFREEDDLNKVLGEVDIVYMTRIQRERMSQEDYEKGKGKYVINMNNFNLIRSDARIMHPLPRISGEDSEIDLPIEIEQTDKRIAYFRQAKNGVFVRMALLCHLLGC